MAKVFKGRESLKSLKVPKMHLKESRFKKKNAAFLRLCLSLQIKSGDPQNSRLTVLWANRGKEATHPLKKPMISDLKGAHGAWGGPGHVITALSEAPQSLRTCAACKNSAAFFQHANVKKGQWRIY